MISPTVGRVVWFWPEGEGEHRQPEAATVAYVHSDTMVNLSIVDHNGVQHAETSVYLLQEGSDRPETRYATWMPYQIGQSKKNA